MIKHYKDIIHQLKMAGLKLISIYHEIDDSCDPEVGFFVVLKGKGNKPEQINAEWALRNYSYNIKWV